MNLGTMVWDVGIPSGGLVMEPGAPSLVLMHYNVGLSRHQWPVLLHWAAQVLKFPGGTVNCSRVVGKCGIGVLGQSCEWKTVRTGEGSPGRRRAGD